MHPLHQLQRLIHAVRHGVKVFADPVHITIHVTVHIPIHVTIANPIAIALLHHVLEPQGGALVLPGGRSHGVRHLLHQPQLRAVLRASLILRAGTRQLLGTLADSRGSLRHRAELRELFGPRPGLPGWRIHPLWLLRRPGSRLLTRRRLALALLRSPTASLRERVSADTECQRQEHARSDCHDGSHLNLPNAGMRQ
jgi:hypothetical protein